MTGHTTACFVRAIVVRILKIKTKKEKQRQITGCLASQECDMLLLGGAFPSRQTLRAILSQQTPPREQSWL